MNTFLKPVLLVTPGPVDGYPPVQYQASILADAGHPVTLLTTPLMSAEAGVSFSHPGVDVRCISNEGSRPVRMLNFARGLLSARKNLPRDCIEIAFDPMGILYSDWVPIRPRHRIAHLHELLQDMDQFPEARLKRAIHSFDLVVVPDAGRASHTREVLGMSRDPLVVENYPLLAKNRLERAQRDEATFEVIYCGSLGLQQQLDKVIKSIPKWPAHARLALIGKDSTSVAKQLKALASELGVQNRVNFLGWMETPAAELRLAQADLGVALLDPSFKQWQTALGASNKRYQLMKAGLPQIGDTNPKVPELLGGIGACVDAKTHDPTDIAAIVAAYAANTDRRAEEGARAFLRHQEVYNYELAFGRLQEQIASW